jgi:hypothetical protein
MVMTDIEGNWIMFHMEDEECYEAYKALEREKTRRALASLRERGRCIWQQAWRPRCGNEDMTGYEHGEGWPFCEKHKGVKCSNPGCDNQAVGECAASSSIVCGAPYCAKCGSHKRHDYNPEEWKDNSENNQQVTEGRE